MADLMVDTYTVFNKANKKTPPLSVYGQVNIADSTYGPT